MQVKELSEHINKNLPKGIDAKAVSFEDSWMDDVVIIAYMQKENAIKIAKAEPSNCWRIKVFGKTRDELVMKAEIPFGEKDNELILKFVNTFI